MNLPDYLSPEPEDLIDPWAHEITAFRDPASDEYFLRCVCSPDRKIKVFDRLSLGTFSPGLLADAAQAHVGEVYVAARFAAKWGSVPPPIQLGAA